MNHTVSDDVLNGSPLLCLPPAALDEVQRFLDDLAGQDGFDAHAVFDPEKHLLEDSGVRKITLTELGISKTHVPAISDVAVTDPFPLFTKEACDVMKWEAFQMDCLKKYGRLPKLAKGSTSLDFQICGYIDQAPFTKAAWTHPRTQGRINAIAGIELQIMFDYEIAHINASLMNRSFPEGHVMGDGNTVYDWHYDLNSFVVVLMLSAHENMIGGKTGLKDGNENIITIEDPKVGYASLLQGRVVKHVANKPVSNHERISSVVGYIPKSVDVPDTTVLTSFRPSVLPRSIHDEYYPAWCEYRFRRVEEMLASKRRQLRAAQATGRDHFDQRGVIEFCQSVEEYIQRTYNEFEVYSNAPYPPAVYSTPYNDLPDRRQ